MPMAAAAIPEIAAVAGEGAAAGGAAAAAGAGEVAASEGAAGESLSGRTKNFAQGQQDSNKKDKSSNYEQYDINKVTNGKI